MSDQKDDKARVSGTGIPLFRKALPFQAKKNWKGMDKRLDNQALDVQRSLGGGILIDYTSRGHTACDISHVIESYGNRRKVTDDGHVNPLGQILAHDFLEYRVGREGLYCDNQGETFLIEHPGRDLDLVDTSVFVRPPASGNNREQT